MSDPALSFDDVSKRYGDSGVGARTALAAVSFDVRAGETIAIVGRSGSGKSTLLHLAAGIDLPSSGHVRAFGRDLAGMTERERTRFRRDDVGLVFQFFHLMPHLSVRENVALPALIAKSKPAVFEPRVRDLLERVSLADRAEDSVQELSGGEMQRVAICRALVRHPSLLLADEPTGNLDDLTGRSVMDLMLQLVSDEGATLVFVTHSAEMASRADTVWSLHSGRLARA
jgi:putative ABC transport system ATP-binding protein